MGKVYERIDESIKNWVEKQQMFFVGTAPRSDDGSVNISPKGLDSLRIIDENTLAYMDFGGSGIETLSHVRENGRIVIMFCAFEGPPKIFRFHGKGEPVTPDSDAFAELAAHFGEQVLGARTIFKIHVDRISDSCGYGVPQYEFKGHRESLNNYYQKKSDTEVGEYFIANNSESIDGLPGIAEGEARAYSRQEAE